MDKAGALVLRATDSGAALAERHAAFDQIVRLFQDMAYACAYAALRDFPLAEDATQEAFITAWRKLEQLREPASFPGWLKRIVLTECNRLTRGKRLRLVPLDDGVALPSAIANPQDTIEGDELKRAVLAAVNSLPRHERMTMLLFYFSNRTHKEIGEFLEVPTTTVAKRLHSARSRLRSEMMTAFKDNFGERRPSQSEDFADRVRRGIYDACVGQYQYELRPDLLVTISREGDQLISEAAGQRNTLLACGQSETELATREFDGRARFVRDAQGQVSHFIYYEFGRELGLAKKIS